jgi:hypothetical protein
MPTSAFFDNDGHQLAPGPSDWQLFAYPQQGTKKPAHVQKQTETFLGKESNFSFFCCFHFGPFE